MEGVRVFSPADWEISGIDATSYVAEDLKKCLEGLARHLFGKLRRETFLSTSTRYRIDCSTGCTLVENFMNWEKMKLKGKRISLGRKTTSISLFFAIRSRRTERWRIICNFLKIVSG